jgi:hypothetical protein
MFRDLSDYVWKWPFSHFKESVSTVDPPLAAKCLPQVPIVYAHAGTQDALAQWVKTTLRRPYILVTGQSDWSVSRSKGVLSDPFLVKWFAQNADVSHQKLAQIPIGLNCFEHAPEMHQALQALREKQTQLQQQQLEGSSEAPSSSSPPSRPHLVLVNFGNTHSSRKKVWEHFCGKGSPNKEFATCSVKSQQNNVRGNPHLVSYYRKVNSVHLWLCLDELPFVFVYPLGTVSSLCYHMLPPFVLSFLLSPILLSRFLHPCSPPSFFFFIIKVASHKFVVAPRGNGWDTHRLWEALYLGCVPIVESSVLDPLYKQLPVLIVNTWKGLDKDALLKAYAKLGPKTDDGLFRAKDTPLLHRPHFHALLEATRSAALEKYQVPGATGNSSRFRCWG